MIIPVIFEQNFEEIKKKVALVEQLTSLIQIDVADGRLVDGTSFLDVKRLEQIKTTPSFEIHLMVEKPSDFVREKVQNVSKICTQVEAELLIKDFIKKGRKLGYIVGLSLNPETPIETLAPYMREINYVQFMTAHPGGKGREFIPEVLDKIKKFGQTYIGFPTQVDGGINVQTLPLVLQSGVKDVVIGTALFGEKDIQKAYIRLLGEMV